ncbi:MAG: 5'-methylthioadenosine/S-adenosylhomocysteine nucleosidase [Gammaproteobacteria bacterium]|nr:5'-methylthioadenosine/S-adenosylhomocysteine nucleosidase [Gammaproteobacteria bacterium]
MDIHPLTQVDYAIISAMPEELAFFLEAFSSFPSKTMTIEAFEFKIVSYYDARILIVHTGIGTAFAASVFTFLHCYFHPRYFLIAGTAGGIKQGLQLNDVVIVTEAFEAEIQHTLELAKETPFANCVFHPIKNQNFPIFYPADAELLELSQELKIENITIHRGPLVSSNAFPAPLSLFAKIKPLNPYCIDMETSAFYQTAWLVNARVLAVRGISNILNDDGTDDQLQTSDVKGSSLAAAQVLLAILTKSVALDKNKEAKAQRVNH